MWGAEARLLWRLLPPVYQTSETVGTNGVQVVKMDTFFTNASHTFRRPGLIMSADAVASAPVAAVAAAPADAGAGDVKKPKTPRKPKGEARGNVKDAVKKASKKKVEAVPKVRIRRGHHKNISMFATTLMSIMECEKCCKRFDLCAAHDGLSD